jgi:hypothetical protein
LRGRVGLEGRPAYFLLAHLCSPHEDWPWLLQPGAPEQTEWTSEELPIVGTVLSAVEAKQSYLHCHRRQGRAGLGGPGQAGEEGDMWLPPYLPG